MAAISIKSTLFLATVLFLITTPPAHAQGGILSGLNNIVQINLLGRLTCSAGLPPVIGVPAVGVPNFPVVLACNRTSTTLTQVLTNPAGFFTFVLSLADALTFRASNCSVTVQLPLANCTTTLPTTGILQSIPSIVSIVPAATGLVVNLVSGVFGLLPAL